MFVSDYQLLGKALRRGCYREAFAAATRLPLISLHDALELTILARQQDPGRFDAMARRLLVRLAVETMPPVDGLARAADALAALPDNPGDESVDRLKHAVWELTQPSGYSRSDPQLEGSDTSRVSASHGEISTALELERGAG
jgi:hypothetical protein